MLNHLFFASLLALSSSSTTTVLAQPAPAPMPTNRGCLVTTDITTPVFQIDRKSDQIKDYKETKLLIVSNGAWVYTETQKGKILRTEGGCLSKAELATLTSSLASATWKTSMAQVRCAMAAADFTQYSYKGKAVLKSEVCDGVILDKATEKAMAAVTAITSKLYPKP